MSVLLVILLQAESPSAVLDALEARARTARSVHADFDLEKLPKYSSITMDFDHEGRRLSWVLRRGEGNPVDHYLVDRLRRYVWTDGQAGTTTDFEPYWGGIDKGWNSILASLLPDPVHGSETTAPWNFGMGINLEGKPSPEGKGILQFYGTYYRVPFRWLGLLREEPKLGLVMNDRTCTFLLTDRRKTVVLDRKTAFLQSIETVDYDGTARAIRCRSVTLNRPLAPFPQPPECREKPVSPQELEEILESRRRLFCDLLGAVLEQWERIVDSGREEAVGRAYAQEISDLLATWWEARLHQVAAAGIQRRLDSGATWQSLKSGELRELEGFVEALRQQCDVDRIVLKKSLEEFEGLVEGLYQQKVPGGGGLPAFRTLLRSSLRFDEIWRLHIQPSGTRATEVYREELDRARQI